MKIKRIVAMLLIASMMMSANAYAAPWDRDDDDDDEEEKEIVIRNKKNYTINEEEVELTVTGRVNKIVVTEDGEDAEIEVAKRGFVKEIVLNAEAEVSGEGKVGVVYVNADEAEIDVPGAKVVVGEEAEDVEAGDVELKPGDVVIINPDGEGVKPVKPEKPEPEKPEVSEDKLAEQAKVVDLGWSKFLTVQFAKGKTLTNTTLTVDGVKINDACTPVTDDGSVVKWEVTSLNHSQLVLTSGKESQTVKLGNGAAQTKVRASAGTPDYFLMNGPVYVWDYHLDNYDAAGNLRVKPAKTTFDLGVDATTSASKLGYSPDAVRHEDKETLKVSGQVELKFNYETAEQKAYVDAISDVDLVGYDERHVTLNDQLTYTLEKNVNNSKHTNAVITVPLGQSNFYSNGRYNLRVTSGGKAMLFPIHVVNEVIPTMTVTGDAGYSGMEVHFRIENMTYGITRPVYRVQLTNPAGKTFELAKYDDWFLHGDLLVLYNDKTNYFPVEGDYTVKVWADGFQPFSKTFHQTAITAPETKAPKALTVDAITTASVGGGSSSSGSGSGDTKFMNANLIIDADLLVNAEIVVGLGLKDEAASGIVNRWDTMSHLYAFNEGAETVYTYENYYDAVNAAETNGQYLTFAEYVKSGNAVTTGNRPYAVKRVLEDNLLGSTTSFSESSAKAAPELTAKVEKENTLVLTCTDKDYMAKLATEGELRLNVQYGGLPMDQKAYTVDQTKGTITVPDLKIGSNTLKITVPGYQTAQITVEVEKVLENVSLSVLNADKLFQGKEIVVRCAGNHENGACDFLKHITGVTIKAPNGKTDNVMPQGAESTFDKIGYTVDMMLNTLTIGKDVLNQDFAQNEDGSFAEGVYTVTITAKYYGEKSVTVKVAAAAEPGKPDTEIKAAPTVEEITRMGGFPAVDRVSFNQFDGITSYLKAVTEVTVGGEPVKKVTNLWNESKAYKLTARDTSQSMDGYDVIDFTTDVFPAKGEAIVVVEAKGYETLTFTVKDGQLKPAEPQTKPAPTVEKIMRTGSFPAVDRVSFNQFDGITSYLKAVTEVTVGGEPVKKVTNLWNESKAYKLTARDTSQSMDGYDAIDFTTDIFPANGEVTVVITADGYADLTFKVKDGKLVTEPEAPQLLPAPGEQLFRFKKDMFRGDHYRLEFHLDKSGAEQTVLVSDKAMTVDAVTRATGSHGGGSVNPGIPPLPEPSLEMKALYAYVSSLKTYLNEVKDSSITINGVEVTESRNATLDNENSFLVIADEYAENRNAVIFNTDCFDNKENAEVVIKVAGYQDLILTVNGETVKSNPQPEPEKPQGNLTAPVAKSMGQRYSSFFGNGFVIQMAIPEGVADDQYVYNFLSSLTSVKVDDKTFTQKGAFVVTAQDSEYDVNCSAGEFLLPVNALQSGEHTIVLTAPNYETLTIVVKDGKLVSSQSGNGEGGGETTVPAAPAVLRLEHKTGFSGSGYMVKLTAPQDVTDNQYVYNFLSRLTEVSVNGTVYSAAGGFRPKPDATHYTMNRSTGEIMFSEESFGDGTGVFKVVLKADGYQNLTFIVTDGTVPTV